MRINQNPFEVGLKFPTQCGKLYVRGCEIPPSVIEMPQESEWKLLTLFILIGQKVFTKPKWKHHDIGMINRDATWEKLMNKSGENKSSDNNIQIALQAEAVLNLYHDFLLQHKDLIKYEEFEIVINQILENNEINVSEEEDLFEIETDILDKRSSYKMDDDSTVERLK